MPLSSFSLNYGNVGFVLHSVVEVPACLNFFLFPSDQLGRESPHAHAVVRQYAVLLFSSVLVAVAFVGRPVDDLSGRVAAALALYHIAPSVRSLARLTRQAQLRQPLVLSEAFLYLIVHALCGAALLHHFITAIYNS
ncbi:hypothetical protein A1O3_03975 [Capronia epimyces CBS 606.96]|uniref:Uncharacterized protein n=1 Tax=Capronia epimyces CBS 606.96 TaxID=1182542 RepID=W9Y3E9_9EURO|nr:uncharacterized protein A1O3_03975 [Capronia epimyces CBS 606.96]EXJ87018.1 hypothetical protein A1O3_03975 [Capronia epimyces CBS 606.96]